MKIALTIIYFSIFHICLGQVSDTANIAFKAKLLTLDRKGLLDKDAQIKDIVNQKLDFIEYKKSNNWIFMRIKFNQKYGNYFQDKDGAVLWLGECYFYLAFKREEAVFYRLGGFDKLDVENFVKDLKEDIIEYDDILTNESLNNIIPINCIEKYVKTKGKKKKTEYKCFNQCSEILRTTMSVY